MLLSIQDVQRTGRAHLQFLAEEIGADAATIQAQGLPLLEQLRTQGIVIGTLPQLPVRVIAGVGQSCLNRS